MDTTDTVEQINNLSMEKKDDGNIGNLEQNMRKSILSTTHNGNDNDQASKQKNNCDNNKTNINKEGYRYEYLNPFTHELVINDRYELIKKYILTVLLLPIRIIFMILAVLFSYIFSYIGLYGLTLQQLNCRPLTGWRKVFQKLTATSMRQLYLGGSFHYITYKGVRAKARDAPILVVAPHSSYVDSLLVVALGPPSIVAKQETSKMPIFGRIINYAQPIYVDRDDPDSRHKTIMEIKKRVESSENWPQIVIFSEGTCTNRKALIQFKVGAFLPGVPIQPVLLKYPNKYDSTTWTWDGPSVLNLLWITLTNFHSYCEIEFLPIYTPSGRERQDAKLFANNVRNVMAKAMNVPVSEYTFEDCICMNRAKDMQIPNAADIIEFEQFIFKLELNETNIDVEIAENLAKFPSQDVDFSTFAALLKIQSDNINIQQLFSLLDKENCGTINLKEFVLCSFYVKTINEPLIEFLRLVNKIYSVNGKLDRDNFLQLICHSQRIHPKLVNSLFYSIDICNLGLIKFEHFEKHCQHRRDFNSLFKKRENKKRGLK